MSTRIETVEIKRGFVDAFDVATFLMAVSLIAVGLVSIYSATFDADSSAYFTRQAVYAGVGLAGMIMMMFVSERMLFNMAYVLYGFSIVLLLMLKVLGVSGGGAKSWLYIGSFGFQPSEVAKLGTLLALARFISMSHVNLRTIRDLGIAAGIVALPLLFVLLEPDPGSGSVFMMMFIGVVLWAGADLFVIFSVVAPVVVLLSAFFGDTAYYVTASVAVLAALLFRRRIVVTALVIALCVGAGLVKDVIFEALPPHQQRRIEVLLNPDADPLGAGYHVIQSKIAVGSGGLTGKGFLQGTQTQLRYIPEQRTDFIYCVPTEEFGFIGGSLVLGLLAALILRAISVAQFVRERFQSVIVIGIAVIWLYHTTVNIGMALGLMPVMGIPLPFLSAGGTALIMNMLMVGIILNFYRRRVLRP